MKTGPFIDRDHVQLVISEAKAQRTRELRDAARWALGTARWGGLSVLVALGLAFSGSHVVQSGAGPTGGDGSALSD